MRNIATSLILLCAGLLGAQEYAYFIPPQGWEVADPSVNGELTRAAFVSKSHPGASMGLSLEPTRSSLKEYISDIEQEFKKDPNVRWRDVGPYTTSSGQGRLVEIEMKSPIGDLRMLQLIFIHGKMAYVVTTSAPKQTFAQLAPVFKKTLQSFTCTSDLAAQVSDLVKQEKLKNLLRDAKAALQAKRKTVESSPEPFADGVLQKAVLSDFPEMGALWQIAVLQMAQEPDLLN